MKDIERRLRDLGEQVRDSGGRAVPLGPHDLRRIRVRRLATIATTVAVVAGLAVGGTYAASELWVDDSSFDVSQAGDVGFARYMPHFSPQHVAVIELNVDDETVCYSVDSLPDPSSIERVEIFHNDQQVGPGHVTGIIDLVPNADYFSPSAGDDCVRSVDRDALAAVIAEPRSYSLLVDYGAGIPLTAGLTVPPPGGSCANKVDFVPTYLPEGWARELQPGGGGGGWFRGVVGHYGGRAQNGTVEKAASGFADLLTEAAYAQSSKTTISVLNASATLGSIHEGYSVEFRRKGCEFVLMGFGVDRDELRRFAEGLRRRRYADVSDGRSRGAEFAAMWPEDTYSEAKAGCAGLGSSSNSFRHDAMKVAIEFATEVLAWRDATGAVLELGHGGQRIELRRSTTRAAVVVSMAEVLPGCWSVVNVGRPPDDRPTGLSISVRGRHVEIGYDALGADSVYFEMGHGNYTTSSDSEPANGRITALLRYERGDTGHFLLLFQDKDGEVFSAAGGPLPPGDFVAG